MTGLLLSFILAVNAKDAPYNAVCNGAANDHDALQAALTAGAGQTVHLPGCLTRAPLTVPSQTTVTGVVYAPEDAAVAQVFDLSNVSDVTFQDLIIQGRGNARGTVGAGFGIRATTCDRVVLRNVSIYDTISEGVKLDGGYGHAVLGGSFERNGKVGTEDHGIAIVAVAGNVSQVRVSGARVSGCRRKGIATYVSSGRTMKDITIAGNTVTDCGLGGIYLGALPGQVPLTNVAVTGNTISGTYVGIEVDHATNLSVTGNCIHDSSHFGMFFSGLDGATIDANTVTSTSTYGVHTSDATGPTRWVVFSNNLIRDSNTSGAGYGPGLSVYNVADSQFLGNIVVSTTQTNGIVEGGTSDRNVFLCNTIAGGMAYYTVGASSTVESCRRP